MKRLVALVAPPLVALALLLGLWEGLVRALEVQAFLLPPPTSCGT